jgi:hypothetical protein
LVPLSCSGGFGAVQLPDGTGSGSPSPGAIGRVPCGSAVRARLDGGRRSVFDWGQCALVIGVG